jgi:hypothetical protein
LSLIIEDGRANPNARNFEAIKAAFWMKNDPLVGLLMCDDRFQPTSLVLKEIYHSTKEAQENAPPEVDRLYTDDAAKGYGAYMRYAICDLNLT